MPNSSQDGNSIAQVGSQATSAPVPADFSATISALSALLSLVAIIIAISSAVYSRRSDRRSLFDSDFGSPLRTSLRELEQSAEELSAFVFPSAKTLHDLKNELQNTQVKIEEKTLATARIIREIDTSTTVSVSGWEGRFTDQAQSARLRLESMYSPMVTIIADFQSRADQAQSDYRKLVAEARQRIDDIRRGCLKHRA